MRAFYRSFTTFLLGLYLGPRGLFDHNVKPVEQSHNGRQGKPGLFDPVDRRVDGIVESRPEIGFFKDRIVEFGIPEVAMVEIAGRSREKIDLKIRSNGT